MLVCIVLIISTLQMMCDTCDSKNAKCPVSVRVRARVRREGLLFFYNSKSFLIRRSIEVAQICLLMFQCVPQKRPVVLWKVTRRFSKNVGDFLQ